MCILKLFFLEIKQNQMENKRTKLKRSLTLLALQQHGQQTVGKKSINRSKQNNTDVIFENFRITQRRNRWP